MVILLDPVKNQTFWLPIYIMNDKSFQSGPYLLLLILEIFLYLLTALILISTVRIFWKTRFFHQNMNVMMAVFLFQWFEAILAKLVIIPYQIGIWRVNDSESPYVSWWSSESTDMISVTDNTSLLLITGFMVWHYAYSMIFGILNLGIERIFASVLIRDYENKPRHYIPIYLIVGTHLITIPFSWFVLTNRTGFYVATSPCFINSLITFGMFLIVWKISDRRRRLIENPGPGCDYTLPQSFQLKENYRALMLAKNLLIVVLCAMSVPCALLIALVLGLIPSWRMLFIHVMENAIYLNPIIICTVLMCSADSWRKQFFLQIRFCKKLPSAKIFVVRPRTTQQEETRASVAPDEGQVYFEQLNKAWM